MVKRVPLFVAHPISGIVARDPWCSTTDLQPTSAVRSRRRNGGSSSATQPLAFLHGDRDSFWQLAPENLILHLEVFNLASQLFLGRTGDHQQQGLKDVFHRGKLGKVAANQGEHCIFAPRLGVLLGPNSNCKIET